ncbi:hypothetical protein F528_2256 [Neisseria meningitidis 992008]|nr:hypothetical protein F528_2256 [Neisseria meningitidis 992008]
MPSESLSDGICSDNLIYSGLSFILSKAVPVCPTGGFAPISPFWRHLCYV